MSWRDDWGWYYKPSRPKKVKGGIRAQSQKGRIGSSWWSKRWIGVLESFGWSNRLARGRSYARSGQVVDLEVSAGAVAARVQGSRPKPYQVEIKIKAFSAKQWEGAIEAMAAEALFAAKLLAGEMPEDIEKAFATGQLALFPSSARDLTTECSCPDFANPCKHIAAVHYILAEEFDRDPFLLFSLRGRTRDELVAALRRQRSTSAATEPSPPAEAEADEAAVPLEARPDTFWKVGETLSAFRVHIAAPAVPNALLKRLGAPAFWKGKPSFEKVFSEVYRTAGERALEMAYGSPAAETANGTDRRKS